MDERVIINKHRPYDAKIEFTQNPEGVVQFSGYIQFDDTNPENIEEHARKLVTMFENSENLFAERGYKLAKDFKDKEPVSKEVKQ